MAAKGRVARPHRRRASYAAIAHLLESVGRKLHNVFFSLGEYDMVILSEAPDNSTGVAGVMVAMGAGTVAGTKTTALLTMDEAVEAMKKASAARSSYSPPSA